MTFLENYLSLETDGDPRLPRTDGCLLGGLGLAHHGLIGPFYETICAQNMNSTTQNV